MAEISEADQGLLARLLGRGEAGELGAKRIAELLDERHERMDREMRLRDKLYEAYVRLGYPQHEAFQMSELK